MYTIRQAHIKDVEHLVQMGKKFYQYSNFNNYIEYDEQSVRHTLANLILNGFLYVAEHKEQGIIAGLAGGMGSLWLNLGTPVATELAWWVEEEHRKSPVALRLYKAFEKWAHDKGVTTIIMSDLVIEGNAPAEKLFNKMGFSVVERSHIKKG